MESPEAFEDNDIEFSSSLIAYRRQALELFDSYEGENEQTALISSTLEGPYEQEVQELASMLKGWGKRVPSKEDSLAESAMEGAIEKQDLEDLQSLDASEQDAVFLALFEENQRGVLELCTSQGEAGTSEQVRNLADEASTQSTTTLTNLQND